MIDADWTDDRLGLWLGECAGCEADATVNDVGLCRECASKLERDLIRERSWEHSVSACALTSSGREALRDRVIRNHGPALELIAPLDRSGAHPRRKRRRENRMCWTGSHPGLEAGLTRGGLDIIIPLLISEGAMVRTVVSLEEDDKRWLDERAQKEGVPMTELIRRGVRLLRGECRRTRPGLSDLLERTAGVWKHGDGLKYQKKMRREW